MPDVITELLQVAYNYLWDASGRSSLGAGPLRCAPHKSPAAGLAVVMTEL